MDPVDVESRIFRTRKTSIYKLLYLVHEDWILEQHGTLPPGGSNYLLQREAKVLTHIRQSQRSRAIHACLTVHVDNPCPRSEEPMEGLFELGIPVQDVHSEAVDCMKALVVLSEAVLKPVRGVALHRTVDDVSDVMLGGEPLS